MHLAYRVGLSNGLLSAVDMFDSSKWDVESKQASAVDPYELRHSSLRLGDAFCYAEVLSD